ncbi:MAG TPA: hypothetical protein VEI02_07730 [Planctomycetota bacterium]|nr:hypothetical protein [Planctomycetota bacterium]
MHAADWAVLAAYGALLLFIGWRAGRGARTAEGHLRADRDLPAWAVVFSVLATEVSAATYVSVPERAFKGDWTYLQFAVGALLGKLALATVVVPLYWRLGLPTVYGFLRQRVGDATHRVATWAFLFGRLGASAVRMYIAAAAFAVVTGASVETAVIGVGALSALYTLKGGLKAVVWTDVAQGTLFFVGAAAAAWVAVKTSGATLGELAGAAFDAGKLRVLAWSPEPDTSFFRSERPFPSAAAVGFFLALGSHGCDQENVQHLLNVRSARGSALSIVVSGLFTFPVVAVFLSVGTALWAFHLRHSPPPYDLADPYVVKTVFPHFIVHYLPDGVRGLAFAGLFAAAVSSLAATLNAATTTWMTDVAPRPDASALGLRRARRLMAAFAVVLVGMGLFFVRWDRGRTGDLVILALQVSSIVYGGLLGSFLSALTLPPGGGAVRDRFTALGVAAGVALGLAFFFFRDPAGRTWIAFGFVLPLQAALAFGLAALGRALGLRTAKPA